MIPWLDEFGNEMYNSMKAKHNIKLEKINNHKDALYVSKFFNTMKWWQINEKKYPELAVAASIVLGKPTHNGFQERVFSRGTYKDSKLKKRLKEDSFEMSIINSVNAKVLDSSSEMINQISNKVYNNALKKKEKEKKEALELKLYLEKKKNEASLEDVKIDDDVDDDSSDELESICSVKTCDLSLDDDDRGDDDLAKILKEIDISENEDNDIVDKRNEDIDLTTEVAYI